MDDYCHFLKSLKALFRAAVKAEDWKLALQIKTLEAKCSGFINRKQTDRKPLILASDEELARILEELE